MKAVVPGTFDPVTMGHVSLVKRAVEICGNVVVALGVNDSKRSLFTLEERIELLKETFKDDPRITIASFEGLLVDFVAANGVDVVVRGIRNQEDAGYELALNEKNQLLDDSFETMLFPTKKPWQLVSSSFVREISRYDVERARRFVPECVFAALKKKFAQ